jgi:hypothetical protein
MLTTTEGGSHGAYRVRITGAIEVRYANSARNFISPIFPRPRASS